MRAPGPSESAPEPVIPERRERAVVVTYVLLLAVAALAWADVVRSAAGMEDMAGMGMAMAPTLSEGVPFVAAWTVMMAAMMLPSAAPMIALYAATQGGAPSPTHAGAPSALARTAAVARFSLVYLALWAATGVPIYVLTVALGAVGPRTLAYGSAVVLVTAGAFQFSALKRRCLRNCRSPMGFLLGHWRPGWRGSVTMGWAHAVHCLGCCWALMLVLVAAGAMGLPWVLLIAAVVAAEKMLPYGERIAQAAGAALVLLGLAIAVRPDLAMLLRTGARSM